jgi:hypothetical protein
MKGYCFADDIVSKDRVNIRQCLLVSGDGVALTSDLVSSPHP